MLNRQPSPRPVNEASNDRPAPAPSERNGPDTIGLLQVIVNLRAKLRTANRERGRTSLTLHLTRLELGKARAQLRTAREEVDSQGAHARRLYYQLAEVMEVVEPGRKSGTFDDDYKWLIGELRRLRSVAMSAEDVRSGRSRDAETDRPRVDPLTSPIENLADGGR